MSHVTFTCRTGKHTDLNSFNISTLVKFCHRFAGFQRVLECRIELTRRLLVSVLGLLVLLTSFQSLNFEEERGLKSFHGVCV